MKDPYKNESMNYVYNLLFYDNIKLFKKHSQGATTFPWDVVLSDSPAESDLLKIVNDESTESRVKVLAYNRLMAMGVKTPKGKLLGVIIEIGMDEGLDTLAAYRDGSARYINYSEKLIVWEAKEKDIEPLFNDLFLAGEKTIRKIGPWDKKRRPPPSKGVLRLTFLVSDGIYFGEGPIDQMSNDPLASEIFLTGAKLMNYLVHKSDKK